VHGVAVDTVWVSDMTYLPTRAGWLYLAVVLDLGVAAVCELEHAGDAAHGVAPRGPADGGGRAAPAARAGPPLGPRQSTQVQYASHDYRTCLEAHKMVASMSGTGNRYDNAVVESFFSTLEVELVMRRD